MWLSCVGVLCSGTLPALGNNPKLNYLDIIAVGNASWSGIVNAFGENLPDYLVFDKCVTLIVVV